MATLYNYGTTDKVPFKITKNGVAVAGLTFSAGDITRSVNGGLFTDITAQIAEVGVGTGNGKGWYEWTPAAGGSSFEYIIINIKEVAGTNFDENGFVLYTGGNVSARFSG